jgi:hypothetical protein
MDSRHHHGSSFQWISSFNAHYVPPTPMTNCQLQGAECVINVFGYDGQGTKATLSTATLKKKEEEGANWKVMWTGRYWGGDCSSSSRVLQLSLGWVFKRKRCESQLDTMHHCRKRHLTNGFVSEKVYNCRGLAFESLSSFLKFCHRLSDYGADISLHAHGDSMSRTSDVWRYQVIQWLLQ